MKLKKLKSVIFDPISHTYLNTMTGGILKGVTTLMKEHNLSADYSGIPQTVLNKAAERGTAIHKMLEDYDDGKSVVGGEFEAELKAYKNLGLKIVCSEYLVSDCSLVASSIDKVIDIGSETEVDLGDVKNTSSVHKEALEWQLGIYKYFFERMNPKIKVRKCWCLHVRDGKARQIEVSPVSEAEVKALLQCEADGQLYIAMPKADADANELMTKKELADLMEVVNKVSALEETLKQLKTIKDESFDRIYNYMIEKNLDEISYPGGKFVLKKPYTTNRIDSTLLKKQKPELFELYSKTTTVKGSVTFKAE